MKYHTQTHCASPLSDCRLSARDRSKSASSKQSTTVVVCVHPPPPLKLRSARCSFSLYTAISLPHSVPPNMSVLPQRRVQRRFRPSLTCMMIGDKKRYKPDSTAPAPATYGWREGATAVDPLNRSSIRLRLERRGGVQNMAAGGGGSTLDVVSKRRAPKVGAHLASDRASGAAVAAAAAAAAVAAAVEAAAVAVAGIGPASSDMEQKDKQAEGRHGTETKRDTRRDGQKQKQGQHGARARMHATRGEEAGRRPPVPSIKTKRSNGRR